MKRLYLLLAMVFIASCLTVPAFGQGASVLCVGQESGGGGIRLYQYDVAATQFFAFEVGTHDGNPANYTNWLMPAGWNVQLLAGGYPDWPEKTAHGLVSPGPSGACPWTVVWTGPAINAGSFGYDHPLHSHDVGWLVSPQGVMENWTQPVGMGHGPVHAPVPEPGSLLILGSGLMALAGTIARRRR